MNRALLGRIVLWTLVTWALVAVGAAFWPTDPVSEEAPEAALDVPAPAESAAPPGLAGRGPEPGVAAPAEPREPVALPGQGRLAGLSHAKVVAKLLSSPMEISLHIQGGRILAGDGDPKALGEPLERLLWLHGKPPRPVATDPGAIEDPILARERDHLQQDALTSLVRELGQAVWRSRKADWIALLRRVSSSGHVPVGARQAALVSLIRLGVPPEDLTEELASLIEVEGDVVSLSVLGMLLKKRPKLATEIWKQRLQSEDLAVRLQAVGVLLQRNAPLDPLRVRDIVLEGLAGRDALVMRALRLLPQVVSSLDHVAPSVDALLRRNSPEVWRASASAVMTLTGVPDNQHDDHMRLVERMAQHRDAQVRHAVLRGLPQIAWYEDEDQILRLLDTSLDDVSVRNRRQAADTLGYFAQRWPALRPLLERRAQAGDADDEVASLLSAWVEEIESAAAPAPLPALTPPRGG